MTAVSEPAQAISTHDLILTLGSTTVPLILADRDGERNPLSWMHRPIIRDSLKMYSGQQQYSDLEPPWTPIAQDDWSGGRGSKNFDKDATMYYTGERVNTMRPGEIILGPKSTELTITTPYSNTISPSNFVTLVQPSSSTSRTYIAIRFTSTSTLTVNSITISLKKSPNAPGSYNPTGTLYVGLAAVSTNNPNTSTWKWSSNSISLADLSTTSTEYTFTLSSTFSLSAADYFFMFDISSRDVYTNSSIQVQESTMTEGTSKIATYDASPVWTTWEDKNGVPYFTMYGADKDTRFIFFEYKGGMYAVTSNDDLTTSKLYLLGDVGVVKASPAPTTTTFTSDYNYTSWSADEAIDAIIVFITGTGSRLIKNWTKITDNGATSSNETSFTFEALGVAPASGDYFVIINTDKFTEITTFATAYANCNVTDVLDLNGCVYFAFGDATVMGRMHLHSSGGTSLVYSFSGYTTNVSAETTADGAKVTYLAIMSDQTDTYIVGAKSGYPAKIYYTPVVDNTGFTGEDEVLLGTWTAQSIGNTYSRITGLDTGGEYGFLVVFKEDYIYRVENKVVIKVDVREMGATKDWRNGRAHCGHGKYMYFSHHNTVMRWIEGAIDRIGPDKAEVAYPDPLRAGYFSSLVGYYGAVYGSICVESATGISTVNGYNGQGWCELYAASAGRRIRQLYIQSIPGNTVDRLWVSVGPNIVWLPMSVDPYNHPDGSYIFTSQGTLISPWYYWGLQGVDKLFNSLKLLVENASATAGYPYVTAEFRIDEGDWQSISTSYTTFDTENLLSSTYDQTGIRIQFALTLYSNTTSIDSGEIGAESPRVIVQFMESGVKIDPKYMTEIMVRLIDDDTQLDNAPDAVRLAKTKLDNLKVMQASPRPVLISSTIDILDGKYAYVDNVAPVPNEVAVYEGIQNRYICTLSLLEIE